MTEKKSVKGGSIPLMCSVRDTIAQGLTDDLLATNKEERYAAFQKKYFNDLEGFARDCIEWPVDKQGKKNGPTPYQNEIFRELPVKRRVSVRGPHGLGKTALAGIATVWFSLTRDGMDWKVPMTASAWRQLTHYLMPEIRKWARRVKWDVVGRAPFDERVELMTQSLRLKTGEAFCLASDNSALIEGAHAAELLYLFDEAKVIPADTWDSAEGAFATGEVYWLSISTPGEPQGRFYEIQARKDGYEDWWVRAVTRDECIAAGQMTEEWAEQRAKQWGETSAVYMNRILGQFAESDKLGVIALSLVEKANEKWNEWNDAKRPGEFVSVGVDVAYTGEDSTVLALRYDTENLAVIKELRRSHLEDTMQTTGRVVGVLDAHGNTGVAVVDVIGYGAGVVDRLRELKRPVIPFNSREGTNRKDKTGELGFLNKRAAAWWNLRELLEGGEVALPPDEDLIGDLTAPRWKVTSNGRIQIEQKEDIKKRIDRSTDSGDAVVYALWSEASFDSSILLELGREEGLELPWR